MDTNPSYGVSRVQNRANVFSTTANTKAHQLSQQNNSAQMPHNTATVNHKHDAKTTHSRLISNSTKLTGEDNYGVINQPWCDNPSFDTIVDQKPTRKSDLPLRYDENKYGVINQPQCNDPSFESCLPLTVNTRLTGENKYGVVNQLRCDDPSFDTTVDQNSDADDDEYGVINQPQCDDLM